MARSRIYHTNIPKSARCSARGYARAGAEGVREREKTCFNGGTRRDVVQVDLWKVGGKTEKEAKRKTERTGFETEKERKCNGG